MECEKIRGSHLDTWERCQFCYRLICHEKQVPDILVPEWAQTGWLLHKAGQEAFEVGVSIEKVWPAVVARRYEIIEEEVKSSWPDVRVSFRMIPALTSSQMVRMKTMRRTLEAFRLSMQNADWFKTEVPICNDLGGVTLVGRTDLVCGRGSEFGIFDYKSSRTKWEHKKVPPQLLRYVMSIAKQMNKPIEKIGAYIINLESGNHVGTRYTQAEADAITLKILGLADEIRSTKPGDATATPGSYCRTLCGYSPSCKPYRNSRHWRP